MGQPAEVSDVDRAATQALAQRIVQSVVDDEPWPAYAYVGALNHVQRREFESLVFQLAQELVQTRRELEEACDIAARFVAPRLRNATHQATYGHVEDRPYAADHERELTLVVARIAELRGKGRI